MKFHLRGSLNRGLLLINLTKFRSSSTGRSDCRVAGGDTATEMQYIPGWVRWVLGLAAFYWLVVLLSPSPTRSRPNQRRSLCQSQLKQVALANMQYIQDFDERFPSLRVVKAQGWVDLLYPYLKTRVIFQCPEGEESPSERSSDYFMNEGLADVSLEKLERVEQIINFGDGVDNGSAGALLSRLPAGADNAGSPWMRHLDGANYGFADGHVKWLNPARIARRMGEPLYTFKVPADAATEAKFTRLRK